MVLLFLRRSLLEVESYVPLQSNESVVVHIIEDEIGGACTPAAVVYLSIWAKYAETIH